MENFAIISDSCCDLNRKTREEYGIDYIPMRMRFEGKDLPADVDWGDIGFHEFYDMMRSGVRVTTAQINAPEYEKAFEAYLEKGMDILSVSCSSALSGSYKYSLVARDSLLKKYPERKIVCIDSRNSCLGLGLMCMTASALRGEGKTLEETAAYIEEHKQEVNQSCTVESLTYLKRAGRVSAASAVFGGMLQIKPILISDVAGNNHAIEKVKGRKNSLVRVADLFAERYAANPYQKVCIVHADCEEDAEELKRLVVSRMPDPSVEVRVDRVGPIIGGSAGPGTVAVYSYGKKVEIGAEA